MQSEVIRLLGETNREIKALISKLSRTQSADSTAISQGQLRALSRKLAQVARRLGGVSPSEREEVTLKAAIDQYIDNLKTLKTVLENVQDSLGKQRDRLKKDFGHLNSARAWAETFRATNRS
jgi:predicted  nucleic acid-binding Zn-ribbon protein